MSYYLYQPTSFTGSEKYLRIPRRYSIGDILIVFHGDSAVLFLVDALNQALEETEDKLFAMRLNQENAAVFLAQLISLAFPEEQRDVQWLLDKQADAAIAAADTLSNSYSIKDLVASAVWQGCPSQLLCDAARKRGKSLQSTTDGDYLQPSFAPRATEPQHHTEKEINYETHR